MTDEVGEVLQRLGEVEQELLALDAQATDERHRLLAVRDDLRERLTALHEAATKGDDRPTEVIRAEIDRLEANAEDMREGAAEPTRLESLEARIKRLWSILGERE
jgi:hypothetical protein